MTTVVLRPELSETLESDAQETHTTVNDLVNEVVEQYLFRRQQEKLDREIAYYQKLHPQLIKESLGQWVAIHNQKLIDQDPDGSNLYRRVRAKYGRTAVLIREVKKDASEELWMRTPSTGKVEI